MASTMGGFVPDSYVQTQSHFHLGSALPGNYNDALEYNTGETQASQQKFNLDVSAGYLGQSQQLSDWVLERMGKKQPINSQRQMTRKLYTEDSNELLN